MPSFLTLVNRELLAGSDLSFSLTAKITLSSASSGGYPNYSYQWFLLPNNNSISNTSGLSSTTPANEGNYPIQVVITDSCGYQQSDIQIINVLPPCQVEIPNVITPNGDLANDYFFMKTLSSKK